MAYSGGFTLVSDTSVEEHIALPISSNAVTIGDMLALGVGATTWSDAAATTEHWQLKAVAMETVAATATEVKCQLVKPGQLWIMETANNSSSLHNGDRMILTDTNTVNNTGTDDASEEACVIQLAPVGAVAEKRILGIIVNGIGINPDAT